MIHHILLRTFAHATEDVSRVKAALKLLLPEDSEIKSTRMEGHFGNPITILEAKLEKRHYKSFLDVLGNLSKAELLQMRDELKRHVDDDCNFYVRFDKQAAYEGDIRLAQTEDCGQNENHVLSSASRKCG